MAVVGGVEVAVRLHIDRGDDLDSRDDRGFTPLMLAAARNRASICQLLIDAGADLFSLDPAGRDALAIARAAGALESASTIESAQALKDTPPSGVERSAQHVAKPVSNDRDDCGDACVRPVNGVACDGAEAHSTEVDVSRDAAASSRRIPTAAEHSFAEDMPTCAELPAAASASRASVVEPLCIDQEDASALDPSRWETDEARRPPPDDAWLATAQAAIQGVITKHAPIDDSADWAHFEAFLPDQATPLPRAEDVESTAGLRSLLLRALREGSVPEFDAEDLCIGADGTVHWASLSRLHFVINDLGAETDERFEYQLPHESFKVYADPTETQDEEETVGDAMAFLGDLESHRNDPMRLYMRDTQRRSLITAEEEIVLAKAMEGAVECALDALASWPVGIHLVLAAIEKARSGERSLNSITAGPRDDVEPDPSELVEGEGPDPAALVAALGMGEQSETDASEDAGATQEEDAATEPLAAGFFKQASDLSALVSSGIREANASDVRATLALLSFKRPFLMELADAAVGDKSDDANRFLAAIRSLAASRDRMAGANLRLVLSIAKRYLYSGLPMDDLIQEGNIGLLKAVDKFDWRRGYKFSTMATWWIRQQVSRSAADDAKTIRLPVHIHERLQRVEREAEGMARANGRVPSSGELAARLGMAPGKIDALLRASSPPLSLHSTDDNGDLIFECIEDHRADPFETVSAKELRSTLEVMLSRLDAKPERVLRMRFGLALDDALTLEEVGLRFDLTRERIRQIESKALKRLDQRRNRERLLGWLREGDPDTKRSSNASEEPEANDGERVPSAASSAPAGEPSRHTAGKPSGLPKPSSAALPSKTAGMAPAGRRG